VPILVVAILCWPFVEIAGFIYVGEHVGILATIALTLLSSLAGAILLRIQGIALLQKMQVEIQAGRVPTNHMGHGALITLAGLCLLVPGFISDIIGFLLFLPPVRSLLLMLLARNIHVVVRSSKSTTRVVDLDPDDWREVKPTSGDEPDDRPDANRRLSGPRD
jgi:UPF0716 protein FxsA